jgi:hypothetical protein
MLLLLWQFGDLHYRWSDMADRRQTRPAFSDISNTIERGKFVAIVPCQILVFFSKTVTRIIYHSNRDNTCRWRDKKEGRGIENNMSTAHEKGPKKPLNKEKSRIESNVNTVQGKKNSGNINDSWSWYSLSDHVSCILFFGYVYASKWVTLLIFKHPEPCDVEPISGCTYVKMTEEVHSTLAPSRSGTCWLAVRGI